MRGETFDPRELALPDIAHNLAAASCFAASGASFANVGDLPGLAYSIRKAIAHLRCAASVTRDLLPESPQGDKSDHQTEGKTA